MNNNPRFEGNHKLYKDDFHKIQDKHILIIGAGGVGSWCAEFMARSGIAEISIIDMDDICLTNINRQVQALTSSIGQFKVEALKERILDINPNCIVNAICDFFTQDTKDKYLTKNIDFVIDAFDSAKNKALLIDECSQKNIPMILSGAAGGKKDPSKVSVTNFKRVSNDMLIRMIRRDLKKHHPDFWQRAYYLPCVYSSELSLIEERHKGGGINCRGALGSTGIMTATFALQICHYVIESFLNE